MAKPPPVQQGFDQAKLYLWVKALEGKVNNLLREVDLLKNDFITKNNQLRKDFKTMNEDTLKIKHEQEQTLQKMNLIIKELKKTAGIEEVTTLKKYMEFWNPMSFVTQKDLNRAIEARATEKHKYTKGN
tara:strand:- start:865 stop:1251 length:387 start_codon:yes stop_codon:yes gene_type:complete